MDDLINSYGCKFICSEQLIMTELPRKVSQVMKLENIQDIKDLLEVCMWFLVRLTPPIIGGVKELSCDLLVRP